MSTAKQVEGIGIAQSHDDTGAGDAFGRSERSEQASVSCRPLSGLFEEVERRGLDASLLIRDDAHSLAFLRNKRNRVHWDEFRTVLDRLADHYEDDEIVDIGRHLVHTEAQRPFGFIAKRFFSVGDFYRAVFSTKSGWGQPMFPCMESTFAQLDDGVFEASLTMRPGFTPSRPFLLVTEGNIIGMPEVLGSAPAEVRTEATERGARFEISAAETVPRLARMRRRLSLPFRAGEMAAELQEAHGSLRSRYDAMQEALVEREQAADALRESETRLRLMLESVEMTVWDWDLRDDIVVIDEVGQKMLGFDQSVISPGFASFLDRVLDEDRQMVADEVQAVLEDERPYAQQFRVSRRGEVRTITARGHAFRDRDGRPVRFIGVGHDVTEPLRRTERQAHLGRVVASSPLEIYVLDPETFRVVDVNAVACRNLGYTHEELRGRDVDAFVSDDEATRAVLASIMAGERDRVFGTVTNLRKDGSTYPIDLTLQTSVLDSRPVLIGIGLDVTDRNRAEQDRRDLEQQLWRTQKLESLGTLASGVTHDFNNLLMAISSSTELAAQDLPEDSPAAAHLRRVLQAAQQGKALAAQILTFSRARDETHAPVDLGPVVADATELLRAALPATLRLETQLTAASCSVNADAGQIAQVVTNLCTNAAQATPDAAGTVEVELHHLDLEQTDVETYPDLRPGPHAVLTVRDHGTGMAPELATQIFDPFFTTREVDGGSGLGLAVVHGIVRAHAGAIEVRSTPGEGTTMKVLLPCAGARGEPTAAPTRERSTGSGTILLVDDERVIADAIALGLESIGFEVATFDSSRNAIEAFHRDPNGFDVVLTDQTMPDLTGLQLAEALRAIRPDIPIVLMSGLAPLIDDVEQMQRLGIEDVLAKPFGLDEAGSLLARILDTPHS